MLQVNETEIDINNPISLGSIQLFTLACLINFCCVFVCRYACMCIGYVCSVWKLAACCPPHVIDHENEEDPNRMGQESARKETTSTKEFRNGGLDIDINLPHPAEMEDDEIAVVDINDDESYKGLNAAEVLRAQVNAEAREEDRKSSTSSSESGAESSGSGSSSTSCNSRNSGSESGTGSH